MSSNEDSADYEALSRQGTGSHDEIGGFKIVVYPFDRYEIKIRLSSSNEFLGIEEVKLNQEFLAHRQRITPSGYHDVDHLYED